VLHDPVYAGLETPASLRFEDIAAAWGARPGVEGDLFTLVPVEMGDPRGWFGTVEAVYDPAKRQA
jgi:hypothetical protein